MTTESTLRIGIIGCGKRGGRAAGATGFGMAHQHMQGYLAAPEARMIAYCDIVEENARAYLEEYGGERVYTDYHEMLARENLDMVSIATWTPLHAEMVIACAHAGVRAVHCEKPMAPSWGEAKRMAAACAERNTQLTFNHQRRFGAPFRTARQMLRDGEIGDLVRIEAMCPNMFDWGTHWFDMCFFYNDETPVEWVFGQIEPRGSRTVYGVPVETQGISHFKYRNGVHGLLVTGFEAGWGAQNRLTGTKGVIEVGASAEGGERQLRILGGDAAGWRDVPVEEGLHGGNHIRAAVLDAIAALQEGREPELSARRALQATELIFATYESSRRRGRVTLPLEIEDSPIQELIEELGEVPQPR